jgi:hypothetical protein
LYELKRTLQTTKFSWSIISIKGRTLSPIVERFMGISRETLSAAGRPIRISAAARPKSSALSQIGEDA